jgi:hypothetical protein
MSACKGVPGPIITVPPSAFTFYRTGPITFPLANMVRPTDGLTSCTKALIPRAHERARNDPARADPAQRQAANNGGLAVGMSLAAIGSSCS